MEITSIYEKLSLQAGECFFRFSHLEQATLSQQFHLGYQLIDIFYLHPYTGVWSAHIPRIYIDMDIDRMLRDHYVDPEDREHAALFYKDVKFRLRTKYFKWKLQVFARNIARISALLVDFRQRRGIER